MWAHDRKNQVDWVPNCYRTSLPRGAAGAQSNVAKLTVLRCIPAESSLRASVRLSAGDCDAGSRSRAAFGRGPDRNQSPSPSWLIFAVATSSIMLRSF